MKLRKLSLISSLMLSTVAFAGANCTKAVLNTVSFPVSVQKWVNTDSARVVVDLNATLKASQLASVQADLLGKLKQLAPQAEWHITSLDRQMGASGLLQVHAQAETRLKGQVLAGIQSKVKQLSHPGMTYKISNVDFTPSFAEVQKARMALRMQVYNNVRQELKSLRNVFPGGKFKVHKVNFNPRMMPGPVANKTMMLTTFGGSRNSEASSPQVSNRMVMNANVVFSTNINGNTVSDSVAGTKIPADKDSK